MCFSTTSNSSFGTGYPILVTLLKFLKLNPDPQLEKQLIPDPQKMNADPQPCQKRALIPELSCECPSAGADGPDRQTCSPRQMGSEKMDKN